MTWPTPYLLLPGNARDALTYYQGVFGGELQLFTFEELGRDDGPLDALAHGALTGRVTLFAADDDDARPPTGGPMLSLLGEDSTLLTGWYRALARDGRVVEPLALREWGDVDGQVVDRFGVHWLIGFTETARPGQGDQ